MTTPKTITSNGVKVCFVEVPEEDNITSWAVKHHMDGKIRSLRVGNSKIKYELCVLPSGNWKLLGDSRELTEEQMKEICEYIPVKAFYNGKWTKKWKNYLADEYSWFSLGESYASLKEANGIVDSKRYVVLIGDKN